MTYSLCLSYFNARHFKKPIEIWGNLVPGMIFFQSIFGYLSFTIIFKWSVDWFGRKQSPPGLLNMLIFMFLSPGTVNEKLYTGQSAVQVGLLVIALIQVPILLLLKPLYLRWENNKTRAMGYREVAGNSNPDPRFSLESHDGALGVSDTGPLLSQARESIADEAIVATGADEGEEHEEFEFSEVMIHQIIHTIGKCLYRLLIELNYPFSSFTNADAQNNRILSQLCFSHCVLSPSLGPFPRSSAAFHCSLENDPRWSFQPNFQRSTCRHDRRHVFHVVHSYCRSSVHHGGD